MEEIFRFADELGPLKLVHIHRPSVGLKGDRKAAAQYNPGRGPVHHSLPEPGLPRALLVGPSLGSRSRCVSYRRYWPVGPGEVPEPLSKACRRRSREPISSGDGHLRGDSFNVG